MRQQRILLSGRWCGGQQNSVPLPDTSGKSHTRPATAQMMVCIEHIQGPTQYPPCTGLRCSLSGPFVRSMGPRDGDVGVCGGGGGVAGERPVNALRSASHCLTRCAGASTSVARDHPSASASLRAAAASLAMRASVVTVFPPPIQSARTPPCRVEWCDRATCTARRCTGAEGGRGLGCRKEREAGERAPRCWRLLHKSDKTHLN